MRTRVPRAGDARFFQLESSARGAPAGPKRGSEAPRSAAAARAGTGAAKLACTLQLRVPIMRPLMALALLAVGVRAFSSPAQAASERTVLAWWGPVRAHAR